MKTQTAMGMQTKDITRIIIGAALILLVPLVAMQFTDEVKWDLRDFITFGILLVMAGLIFQLVMKKVSTKHRGVIAAAFIVAILLIWAELAVGVFGTPFAGS